jgi:glycerol-3-phosphate acyltransferase PlsY
MQPNEIAFSLISFLVAYLICSIPFALIVGKGLYKIDIRNYGSKNLGGTNAGRVLGKKAGVLVIALDILKNVLVSVIIRYILTYIFKINDNVLISNVTFISLAFGVIGHCYPIFADFRGGKAVSTAVGLLLCTNYGLLVVFVISFFSLLKLYKMVSLSSITTFVILSILSFIPFTGKFMLPGLTYNNAYALCVLAVSLLLIYRHRENIKRIINKKERKITWMK